MAFVKEVMAALVWEGDYIRIRIADGSIHPVLVKGVVLSSAHQVNVGVQFADGTPVNLQFRKIDMLSVYMSVPARFQKDKS